MVGQGREMIVYCMKPGFLPLDRKEAVTAVKRYIKYNPYRFRVIFCVHSDEDYRLYKKTLKNIGITKTVRRRKRR